METEAGDSNSIIEQGVSRTEFLRRAAGGVGSLAVAPSLLKNAQEVLERAGSSTNTIRVIGLDIVELSNWKHFTRTTGLHMSWKPMNDDVGIITAQLVKAGAADHYDLVAFDGGLQRFPQLRKYLSPIDPNRLHGWSKVVPQVRNSRYALLNGKAFAMPVVFNADSFGYWPKDLGPVNSWKVMFEDNRTLGKVALEDNWLSTPCMAASYLAATGRAKIHDPGNMTPSEIKTVVDFLIKRKKAGQFRTLWSTWEESLGLLGRREVLAINCWEPAIRALLQDKKKVAYATPREGYGKWVNAFYITRGAVKRGNLANVYKTLNYFLGGYYGAQIAILRGYASGRPDLAATYIQTHARQFKAGDRAYALQKFKQVRTKFAARYFWENTAPDHLDAIEAEWERFKHA